MLHLEALDAARKVLAGTPSSSAATLAQRRHPPPGVAPVAILASFARDKQVVFPLWPGINRVGRRPPTSSVS